MGTDEATARKWPAQAAYDVESPTGVILDRIADKWTLMIHGTLEAGPMRFSDLREALGGISPKVLTQSLRALERDGLVARRAYKQVPPKVEYSLTELGGSLCAPVQELRAWAEDHIDDIRDARDRYDSRDGDARRPRRSSRTATTVSANRPSAPGRKNSRGSAGSLPRAM